LWDIVVFYALTSSFTPKKYKTEFIKSRTWEISLDIIKIYGDNNIKIDLTLFGTYNIFLTVIMFKVFQVGSLFKIYGDNNIKIDLILFGI
jgi:hypothetical protein